MVIGSWNIWRRSDKDLEKCYLSEFLGKAWSRGVPLLGLQEAQHMHEPSFHAEGWRSCHSNDRTAAVCWSGDWKQGFTSKIVGQRFVVVRFGSVLFASVYLPAVGSNNCGVIHPRVLQQVKSQLHRLK